MADVSFFLSDLRRAPAAEDTERNAVQEVLLTLQKALRTHQLYDGSGPVVERVVDALRDQLAHLWKQLPVLALRVEEHEILWDGAPVYRAEKRTDDLAFPFYRDGIRELILLPGFEGDDLLAFLGMLARVRRLREEEDDLLTLLWELDLTHLRYRYVDAALHAPDPGEAGFSSPPAIDMARVRMDAAEGTPGLSARSSLSVESFQDALYFLDEAELARLRNELAAEDARDIWADVLAALFDRLEDGSEARQVEIVAILADLLPTLLGLGELGKSALLLRELAALGGANSSLSASAVQAARAVREELARPENVVELIRATEHDPAAVSRRDLSELLSHLPPQALRPLIAAEAHVMRSEVREALLAAIERMGKAHPARLLQLLAGEDEASDLLIAAVRWSGRLQLSSAISHLTTLIERPDAELKLAVVHALHELGGAAAAGSLARCLGDADRDVRIAAARALGELRYPPARAPLEQAITSKRIREVDLTERLAFFEAFGSLAGADGVAPLARLLNRRSWLGRREPAEIRASAALALGHIPHPAAAEALSAAAGDSDPVVRSAVGRALQGATR